MRDGKGREFLIDRADEALCAGRGWYVDTAKNRVIVVIKKPDGKQTTLKLHRFLMNAPPHLQVDHINGNRRDNRRANLRLCTLAENLRNTRKRRTGFKGVQVSSTNRFSAEIVTNRERTRLGTFQTATEAALAYDKAARRLHGEFACVNFPEDGEQSASRHLTVPQASPFQHNRSI